MSDRIQKKILCFGDSNTFGYNPLNKQRYNNNERWTKLLEKILNDKNNSSYEYNVIEEGKIGRSMFISLNMKESQPAIIEFPIIYNKYAPVDYIVICLGTNDLRSDFNLDSITIATGVEKIIKLIQRIDITKNAKTVLVCPPRLSDDVNLIKSFNFDKFSTVKSYDLPLLYKEVANMNNCLFMDAGSFAKVSSVDGVHFSNIDHENFAREIAQVIYEYETRYNNNEGEK